MQYHIYQYSKARSIRTPIPKSTDLSIGKSHERFQKPQESDNTSSVRRRYVLLGEMAKQIRDPVQLRYHGLAIFLPGRDATALAVGNMLF